MREWTSIKFTEACNVNPTYKFDKGKVYSFIDMAAVNEDSPNVKRVVKKEYEKQSGARFRNGDVIFARITPCTENGKTALIQGLETEYGFGSTEFIVLSPKEEMMDSKYLFYLVKDSAVRGKAIARMTGSTGRQRVPAEFFKEELNIVLPPFTEQQKIAEILSSVDEAIEKTEAIIKQTETVKKGLMQQLLTKGIEHTEFKQTDVGTIPTSWHVVALTKLINSLQAGVSVNSENRSVQQGEKGILKTSAVTNRVFNPNEHKAILPTEVTRAKISPQKNAIIISRMNTPALVGASSFVDKDYTNLYLPDRLWQAEINSEHAISLWLSYVLTWNTMRERIGNIATGTSGSMKNISKAAFLNLSVALPSLEEQKQIADILFSVDQKLETEKQKVQSLNSVKKSLMQSFLTGKVRVNVDQPEVLV